MTGIAAVRARTAAPARVALWIYHHLPLIVAGIWILLMLFPELLTHANPTEVQTKLALLPPSAQHWFGTDEYGRDVFARCLYGLRSSLGSALVVAAATAIIGIVIGGGAGLGARWVDAILMRTTDVFLAFPYLIMAIVAAAAIGPGLATVMLVLTLLWWPSYARMIRGQVLSLRELPFVAGARASLTPEWKILVRHLVPHLLPQLSARISLELGAVIIALTGLSFLGLGAQPPTPELGAIIADGRQYILTSWWICTMPGLFIVGLVITSMSLSDWIERRIS